MSYIEKLKIEVDALASLLADPHPGLSTWAALADERIAAIRTLTEPKLQECVAIGQTALMRKHPEGEITYRNFISPTHPYTAQSEAGLWVDGEWVKLREDGDSD